jgi:hypothetical protein
MSIVSRIAERIPEVVDNVVDGAKDLIIAPNPNLIAPNPNIISPNAEVISQLDGAAAGLPFSQILVVLAFFAFTGYALWRNKQILRKL